MPLINGEGFTIAVKEHKIDSLGIDFRGRLIRSNLTLSLFSNHAADMATILAGEDNILPSTQRHCVEGKIMSIYLLPSCSNRMISIEKIKFISKTIPMVLIFRMFTLISLLLMMLQSIV